MARPAYGGRQTCEGCKSLDVRRLHRDDLLRASLKYSWSWSRNGEPSGDIRIETESDALILIFRVRQYGAEWKDIRQRVPIDWTSCRFGGRRPWFICAVYKNGRYCGRRAVKFYGAGDLFACRSCCDLAYASQQQSPRDRGVSQAQKIKERLGGSASLFGGFPDKPRGMHWRTYERLRTRAEAAEEFSTALLMQYLLRRYPRPGAVI